MEDLELDCSNYGKFTDIWEEGAIKIFPRPRGTARYFIPEYPLSERIETYNDKYHGMSKQDAFIRANKDVRKDLELAKDAYSVYVKVISSKNGIELGSYGICCDGIGIEDEIYKKDVLFDIIPCAIEKAKEALKELCKCNA